MEDIDTNQNIKKFEMRTETIIIDDYKVSQVTNNNLINKKINIIFLDKIEFLSLTSIRDIRLLITSISFIAFWSIYIYFKFNFLGNYSLILPILGIIISILFYFLKTNALKINASSQNQIITDYNEELLKYLIEKTQK